MVDPTTRRAGSSSANLELLGYLADLVARRRKEPADDLISAFVLAEADGDRLTDEEISVNSFALALGGYQADRNTMGGAMAVLVENPDQLDLVAADPALIPWAVEELLRWATPTITLARVALHDTEISGLPISKMDRVSVWLISANRDEEVFPDPYKFLVSRKPNRHFAFGNGGHFCAGAQVARTEMKLILDFMISNGLRPELAAAPTPLSSHFQRGFTRLPLRMVRR
jgi:cytochrome P450